MPIDWSNPVKIILGIFYWVLFITRGNGAWLPNNQQPSSFISGTPQLSNVLYESQQTGSPFRNLNENQNKIEKASKADDLNPCNGAYIKTNGTTCGLKEIMIGRCYQYQYVKRGLFLSTTT